MQSAELDLKVAFLGDFECVSHRVRDFAEQGFHLIGRAQVKLLRHVAHALRVAEQGLRADADECVVRVGVAFLDVMHVVRRHQLQTELLRPVNQVAIDFDLLGDRVVLEFEIEFSGPKVCLNQSTVARPLSNWSF